MKESLDRYIRSLAERENATTAPDQRQDLGTFVGWLLPRLGYRVLLHAYKYDGLERVKSAGRRQWGVDILAAKPDDDGEMRIYRFVLKQGHIRAADWRPGILGSLPHDLWLAAGLDRADDARTDPGIDRLSTERVTVIAVHNGDLDREDLKVQVDTQRQQMERRMDVQVDWWDAPRLLELALLSPVSGEGDGLETVADPGLFPPIIRPFARLALDSLVRLKDGGYFDLDAVQRLLEQALPVASTGTGEAAPTAPSSPSASKALNAPNAPMRQVYRKLTELSLFAEMVRVQCERFADGNTLPSLDTLERISTRAVAALAEFGERGPTAVRRQCSQVLNALITQYIKVATHLRQRLTPLLAFENGLATSQPSDQIDYPIRVLRFSGYLATAGLALLDSNKEVEAKGFADTLTQLWDTNQAAAYHPVTDDQIIELALVWRLWLRLGRLDQVRQTAEHVVQRLVWRRGFGLPLPAVSQRACAPFRSDHRDARVLATVYFGSRDDAPEFSDNCSTILPLANYLVRRLAASPTEEANEQQPDDRWMDVFGSGQQAKGSSRPRGAVFPQSWQPPDDAAHQWYIAEITRRGMSHVFALDRGSDALADEFEAAAKPLPESPAEAWKLPVIDAMAWKLWRTPPPMSLLLVPTR